MGEQEFISLCRRRVAQYYVIEKGKKEYDYSASSNSKIDNIYVVWVCKIVKNNKALLSTNEPDGMYFECTYDGEKEQFYFDAYKREFHDSMHYEGFNADSYEFDKKLKEIDPRMFLLCVNDGPASVEVADDTGDWYEAYDFPKNHFNYKGLTRLLKRMDQSKFEELQKTIDEFNKKRLKQKRR